MKSFSLLLAVTGILVVAQAATEAKPSAKTLKPSPDKPIRRIEFLPVPCVRRDCWAQDQNAGENAVPTPDKISHGNIRLEYMDGRKQQVTHQNTAVGNASTIGFDVYSSANPQISPDRITVGWTQGSHQPCTDWSIGGTMFVNSQLVLFRNGRLLRILQAPGTFITGWRFWNDGKYVAVGSRWHHGLGYVRLFDVNSGKLLERHSTPDAAKKNMKWAQDLTP